MLKIRLKRFGRTHSPTYRVVVMPARSKRDGKALDELGNYNPMTKELNLDGEKAKKWLDNGAQPTYTVARMLVKENILKESDVEKKNFKKEPGKKATERAEKKAEKEKEKSGKKENKDTDDKK